MVGENADTDLVIFFTDKSPFKYNFTITSLTSHNIINQQKIKLPFPCKFLSKQAKNKTKTKTGYFVDCYFSEFLDSFANCEISSVQNPALQKCLGL